MSENTPMTDACFETLERKLAETEVKRRTWMLIATERAIEVADLQLRLRDALELLGDAQSGYIPGCGADRKWQQRKDKIMETPNAELTGAAPHGQQTKPQEIEE
jgi:hypothetical protein